MLSITFSTGNRDEEHHNGAAVDDRQLMEVAKAFNGTTFECKQLAVHLKISDGSRFVSALRDTDNKMAAFKTMQTWKKENGSAATREELQRVLRDKPLSEAEGHCGSHLAQYTVRSHGR